MWNGPERLQAQAGRKAGSKEVVVDTEKEKNRCRILLASCKEK